MLSENYSVGVYNVCIQNRSIINILIVFHYLYIFCKFIVYVLFMNDCYYLAHVQFK